MEQDLVWYIVYPDLELASRDGSKERLLQLQAACLSIVKPLISGYVWQHEPFNLHIRASHGDDSQVRNLEESFLVATQSSFGRGNSSSEESFVPHLFGKIRFGDNLEDEWFLVYLLFEISRLLPNVSITVRDTDGEFLLIEAAYVIPRWLRPETSHNRVFVRQGCLHIIPPASSRSKSSRADTDFSLRTSLQNLVREEIDTRATDKVQNVLQHRIREYPQRALQNMHRARCIVPLPVAQILRHEPQLISLAVESFYTRDAECMKAASRMEKFISKDTTVDTDLVSVVVCMSRAMFAQLVQQVFQAPRSYPMPALTSQHFKEAELGMKITCGFEMMYSERSSYKEQAEGTEMSVIDSDFVIKDLTIAQVEVGDNTTDMRSDSNSQKFDVPFHDKGWQVFFASLEKTGYFRGLLDGSREHRHLLQKAVAQYRSTKLFSRVSSAMLAPVTRVNSLLSLPHTTGDFLKSGLEPTDDDSWLCDGEEDLTTAILERQKEIDAYELDKAKRKQSKVKMDSSDSQNGEKAREFQPADVAKSMHAFVDKVSSFEGAEVPARKGMSNNETMSVEIENLLRELESSLGSSGLSELLEGSVIQEDVDTSSDEDEFLSDRSSSEEEAEEGLSSFDRFSQEQLLRPKEIKSEVPGISELHGDKMLSRDALFMNEYSEILENELQKSTLTRSFTQAKDLMPTANFSKEHLDCDTAESSTSLDIDVNLVESLLRSYSYQQGLPGPASNLLGAMGLELPDDKAASVVKKPGGNYGG